MYISERNERALTLCAVIPSVQACIRIVFTYNNQWIFHIQNIKLLTTVVDYH
jgi:hypothetical protein